MNEDQKQISVGFAGWSYADWSGYVYNRQVNDQLKYLAGFVDMIEINTTFYRPPDAKNSESWIRRTADYPDFFFTAKLHQDITHEGVMAEEMVRAFHEGFKPMASAGKLRHLLAQFRYDFIDSAEHRDHLKAVRDRFGDIAELVLELRHKSWQQPEALDFLKALEATVANLDYPLGQESFDLQECRIGKNGYLRLHGRNTAAWFDKKVGRDETYNYYYSAKERSDIRDRALSLIKSYRALTIVANNHYHGKQVANALQLKALLTGQKVRVPEALLPHYPELKEIARPEPGRLF